MVDTRDLKSLARKGVPVRLRPRAPEAFLCVFRGRGSRVLARPLTLGTFVPVRRPRKHKEKLPVPTRLSSRSCAALFFFGQLFCLYQLPERFLKFFFFGAAYVLRLFEPCEAGFKMAAHVLKIFLQERIAWMSERRGFLVVDDERCQSYGNRVKTFCFVHGYSVPNQSLKNY
jgi:hypothetical protein